MLNLLRLRAVVGTVASATLGLRATPRVPNPTRHDLFARLASIEATLGHARERLATLTHDLAILSDESHP